MLVLKNHAKHDHKKQNADIESDEELAMPSTTSASSSRPVQTIDPAYDDRGPEPEGELNYFDREEEELAAHEVKRGPLSPKVLRVRLANC